MTQTPEEKAREIAKQLDEGPCLAFDNFPEVLVAEIIATAIREARVEALEAAARVARETYTGSNGKHTAARILALKDKPARDIPEVTEEGGACR
jgi:hypothetical protein